MKCKATVTVVQKWSQSTAIVVMHRSDDALQAETILQMETHVLFRALLRLSSRCDRDLFSENGEFVESQRKCF